MLALDLLQVTNKNFFDQVTTRLISQIINRISSVLQKLLRCFNGTNYFNTFCAITSCLPCYVLFKLEENSITVITRKTNNNVIIV